MKETAKQIILRHSREISKVFNRYLVPATERTSGLMTPQDKSDVIHALGTREWVGKPIDILNLNPGRYAGYVYNLLNGPYQNTDESDKTVFEVDISQDLDRKQIFLHYSGRGEVYYRNIHQNDNNNPQAWQRMIKEVQLWDGTAEHSGQELVLSETLRRYSRVKIRFNAQSRNRWEEYDIPPVGQNLSIRDLNLSDGDGSWVAVYETRLQRVNDTKFKIASSTNKLIGSTGNVTDDTNQIIITGILGIR